MQGLQALRSRLLPQGARLQQRAGVTSSRKFSSLRPSLTARTTSRTSFASSLARQTTAPLLGASFVRYNSSAPTPTPAPTEVSTPFDPATSNLLADTTTTEVATNVTKVVDETKTGFLSELGIDNGFGPTSLIESLMENIHVYTGLPWWGTIIATTVVIRTFQFPFYCKLSDTAARLRELTPFTAPIEKKMMEEQRRGNLAGMMTAKQEMAHIYKTAKVNRLWLAFPITQIPIFFGFYNGLRGMAEFPVPGMLTGGFGWIKDLTVMDPYFLMPALSSASLAAQFWLGGEAGADNFTKKIKLILTTVVPIMSFAFFFYLPVALSVYLCANSTWSLLQNVLFKNAKVREMLGLYPLNQKASVIPTPAQLRMEDMAADLFKTPVAQEIIQKSKSKDEAPKAWYDKILEADAKQTGTGVAGTSAISMKEKFDARREQAEYDNYEIQRQKKIQEKIQRDKENRRLRKLQNRQ